MSRKTADEAYRFLRSTVKFAAGERAIRSVLVVDIDRETPSGVARELSASIASAGDRCLLIDATPPPSGGARAPGFCELLAGTADLPAIVKSVEGSLLTTIGPGMLPTSDLLAGDTLEPCLAAALAQWEFVVVSCASLPASGDALAIAPRVDATILVITSGKTGRGNAVQARDALERVAARMLGVVMVEPRRRWFW